MNSPKQEASVIEIRDAALDQTAIREQIAKALSTRDYLQNVAQVGPQSLYPGHTAVSLPSSTGTETLNRLLIDLAAHKPLQEHSFTSGVPLLGPLIVAFRRAWNSVSTRWYVLPLMHQQATLNRHLQLVINELAQQQELNTQRIAKLEARLQKEER